MAEYINKKYLDRKFQIDMMALRGGTIFDTKKIIDSLPTTDVIERSEHLEQIKYIQDNLKTYIDNTRNEYYAMERSYNRLKAGVDKTIEEMEFESINIEYAKNHKLGASYGIRKSIEILKRNIGE